MLVENRIRLDLIVTLVFWGFRPWSPIKMKNMRFQNFEIHIIHGSMQEGISTKRLLLLLIHSRSRYHRGKYVSIVWPQTLKPNRPLKLSPCWNFEDLWSNTRQTCFYFSFSGPTHTYHERNATKISHDPFPSAYIYV